MSSKSKERKQPTPVHSEVGQTRSPQQFLPPSHYAAASGMQLPRNTHNVETNVTQFSNLDTFEQPGLKSNMIPISYPSRPPSPLMEQFHMITPIPARTAGHTDTASERGRSELSTTQNQHMRKQSRQPRRRSSQLDLPELEKDLLPSLRDTVYRMTRNSATPSPNLGSDPAMSHTSQTRPTQSHPTLLLSPPSLSDRSSSLPRSFRGQKSPTLASRSPDIGSNEHGISRFETTIEQARRHELAERSTSSTPSTSYGILRSRE